MASWALAGRLPRSSEAITARAAARSWDVQCQLQAGGPAHIGFYVASPRGYEHRPAREPGHDPPGPAPAYESVLTRG
eukprot:gene6256-2885_t